jgi:hypothetical protein
MSHEHSDDQDICCPKFEPAPWEEKTHHWENKLFIKDSMRTFFHIPFPPTIAKLMTRMWNTVQEAQANPERQDVLILAYDPTPFKCEYYMTVTKEVPGAENVTLSGTFLSKVFDGPYGGVPKWIKIMDKYVAAQGKQVKRYYIHYTSCPKCAKKYGHNYIVLFAQVD